MFDCNIKNNLKNINVSFTSSLKFYKELHSLENIFLQTKQNINSLYI